jgi:hypothetical protein
MRVAIWALVATLGLAPATVQAQTAGPNFVCESQSLIVGAAEVSGLRVHCAVSGAPAGDQVLRIVSDRPQPFCEVPLAGGGGDCVGTAFGSSYISHVVAVLMPSGTQFDVLAQQPAATEGTQPSLQYTPLPSDTSRPETDQPAPDAGSI